MFTGIVTDIGRVARAEKLDGGTRFRIATGYDPDGIDLGASIACSGVCLTVTALPAPGTPDRWFEVEAWEEALRLTTAGTWMEGTRLNLERALKVGDELGGHLVSGHVDGMAGIVSRDELGESTRFRLKAAAEHKRYVARKGSICLDGTSLTVNGVDDDIFDVLLIRHSLGVTTWGERRAGEAVNIEIDQIARYAERLFASGRSPDGEA